MAGGSRLVVLSEGQPTMNITRSFRETQRSRVHASNSAPEPDQRYKISIHVPSIDTGCSRVVKLREIDSALEQLRALRRTLTGESSPAVLGHPSLPLASARDWWLAGIAFAVLLLLLMIGVRLTSNTEPYGAAPGVGVVHEIN